MSNSDYWKQVAEEKAKRPRGALTKTSRSSVLLAVLWGAIGVVRVSTVWMEGRHFLFWVGLLVGLCWLTLGALYTRSAVVLRRRGQQRDK